MYDSSYHHHAVLIDLTHAALDTFHEATETAENQATQRFVHIGFLGLALGIENRSTNKLNDGNDQRCKTDRTKMVAAGAEK